MMQHEHDSSTHLNPVALRESLGRRTGLKATQSRARFPMHSDEGLDVPSCCTDEMIDECGLLAGGGRYAMRVTCL
jgi:hypothetical protein